MRAATARSTESGAFAELTALSGALSDTAPARALPLDPGTLQPFQRTLLGLGGMVTQFLEEVWGESIAIALHRQFRLRLDRPLPALDWSPLDWAAQSVVAREVSLRGAVTGRLHGHARTLLLPERIGAEAADAILDGPESIGRALARLGRPTGREILWSGALAADPADRDLPPDLGSPSIARIYRILVADRPAILILERFPRDPG